MRQKRERYKISTYRDIRNNLRSLKPILRFALTNVTQRLREEHSPKSVGNTLGVRVEGHA